MDISKRIDPVPNEALSQHMSRKLILPQLALGVIFFLLTSCAPLPSQTTGSNTLTAPNNPREVETLVARTIVAQFTAVANAANATETAVVAKIFATQAATPRPPTRTPAPASAIPTPFPPTPRPSDNCADPGSRFAFEDWTRLVEINHIIGTASVDNFGYYIVDFADPQQENWRQLYRGTGPVVNNELMMWNLCTLGCFGEFDIRLRVFLQDGNMLAPCRRYVRRP